MDGGKGDLLTVGRDVDLGHGGHVQGVIQGPGGQIDKWVRRRLRCYAWKQWGSADYRELSKRGVSVREAFSYPD